MWSDVLPLAVAMMAGPQILSALVFITTENAVKISLAYILGIALAATLGLTATYLIFSLVFPNANLGESGQGTLAAIVQAILIIALIFLAIRTYLTRDTAQTPAWLNRLNETTSSKALKLGFLVIWLMPSDIVILVTTGLHLSQGSDGISAAIPFLLLTVLIASLPLLGYLIFHKQMQRIMPNIHEWISSNGWLVNIFVYVLFILIIL